VSQPGQYRRRRPLPPLFETREGRKPVWRYKGFWPMVAIIYGSIVVAFFVPKLRWFLAIYAVLSAIGYSYWIWRERREEDGAG
jgi:hypothetical protein